MSRQIRIEYPDAIYHLMSRGITHVFTSYHWNPIVERSELGSRDVDGRAKRPSERARTSQWPVDGSYWGYRIYGTGPDEVLWNSIRTSATCVCIATGTEM